MQNAQIWKSIEALSAEAEAEAGVHNGALMMTVINSIPPPALSNPHESGINQTGVGVIYLTAKSTPPMVKLIQPAIPADQTAIHNDGSLLPASLTEIAAAIEEASKLSKPQIMQSAKGEISDQARQQLIAEITDAVRDVLTAEVPKMVRQSVTKSLHELITISASQAPAIPQKAPIQKVGSQKAPAKKAPTQKAAVKKSSKK